MAFSHCAGRHQTGDHRYRPLLAEVVDVRKDFLMRGWDLIFPGWRWLTETKVVITTQCGAVSTLGTIVFVPRVIGVRDVWKDFSSRDLIHRSHIGVSTPCEAV